MKLSTLKKWMGALVMAAWPGALVFAQSGEAGSSTGARPNVVVILADDLGYGDVGCYGATKIKTPNIDRLASEGCLFTQAYTPSSVCSPTRYGVLSGCYAWRTPRHPANQTIAPDSPLVFETGQPTLASLFKGQGIPPPALGNGTSVSARVTNFPSTTTGAAMKSNRDRWRSGSITSSDWPQTQASLRGSISRTTGSLGLKPGEKVTVVREPGKQTAVIPAEPRCGI